VVLLVLSLVMFAAGETLIAAFLPEITSDARIGRMSGYGWGVRYLGGLVTLAGCLGYITWARNEGQSPAQFIPVTLWITGAVFAIAALPTFLLLRERTLPTSTPTAGSDLSDGFDQVRDTCLAAGRFLS
jgi:UMF1 family MFS transporter